MRRKELETERAKAKPFYFRLQAPQIRDIMIPTDKPDPSLLKDKIQYSGGYAILGENSQGVPRKFKFKR